MCALGSIPLIPEHLIPLLNAKSNMSNVKLMTLTTLFWDFSFQLIDGEEVNRSYMFWIRGRQAQTHSGVQLPDYGMNPKLHARSQRHWKQTHSKISLPAQ